MKTVPRTQPAPERYDLRLALLVAGLLTAATAATAETVIINHSVNTGQVDIGSNAHTGSIVIDGVRVGNHPAVAASRDEAAAARARVGSSLDQAQRRIREQLQRLSGRKTD